MTVNVCSWHEAVLKAINDVCFEGYRTSAFALHMSAFGGRADMNFFGNPLSWSLSGVKRTCLFALHMSAYDPKRTLRDFECEC
jgi:hypothetical protein